MNRNNEDSCWFTNTYIPTPASVTIAKTDNHTTALPGETLTYEITLTNTGDMTANGVMVDDTLPGFLSAPTDISDNGVYASGHIVWNNLTVLGHSTISISFKGVVNVGTTASTYILHNEATLGCGQFIGSTLTALIDRVFVCSFSGTATDETSVTTAPTITLTKTVDATTVKPDQTVNYTITWSVGGNAKATNVILTDSLPATLNFVSADNSGTYSVSTRTITWNLGTKNPGDTGSVHVVAKTYATMANGITITNSSAIKATETEPKFASASSTSVVPQVLGATTTPGLSITKVANVSSAKPNTSVTYTITVKNTGDGEATNVVVTDTIPSGLSFIGATGKTQTWELGTLTPGETKTITVDVRVNSTAEGGSYTNVASAAADDVAMVQASATIKVPTVLGLATTGTSWFDYLIALVGASLVAFGMFGLKKPKRVSVQN